MERILKSVGVKTTFIRLEQLMDNQWKELEGINGGITGYDKISCVGTNEKDMILEPCR